MNIQNKKILDVITPRIFVILLMFFFMVGIFALITNEIVLENETAFDEGVFNFLMRYKSEPATKIFTFFTFFGSGTFLLPAYLLIISFYIFFSKNVRRSIKITIIGLSSTILLFTTKFYFHRQRPINPLINNVSGFSFPSGHSFSSFILCGIIIYIIAMSTISISGKWLLSFLTFLVAFLIALSRVYLRVHFASDAIAGFCLSMVWLTFSFWLLTFIFPSKKDGVEIS